MRNYRFVIIASGVDPDSSDFEDRFFTAGCDDATIAFQKGVIVLDFEREARNFAHAIFSAVDDVRRAGAQVERIEPDYLVSVSDIASRSGLSRSAISLFSKGERGAEFPPPVARVTSESPLWDWVEVSRWMRGRGQLSGRCVVEAKMLKAVNQTVSEIQDRQGHLPFEPMIRSRLSAVGTFETAKEQLDAN